MAVEADDHAEPYPVVARRQRNSSLMARRDMADDGQTEAAAAHSVATSSPESNHTSS